METIYEEIDMQNSRLTFIYLNIVNDVFYGADYELYTAYIRSYLKDNGVNSNQYINININSLEDFVQSITRQASNRLVFYLNEYNFYISKVVINRLKLKEPDIEIIAIGPTVEYIERLLANEILIDYYCKKNVHDTLRQISKLKKGNNYESIKSKKIPLECIPQPYSNGVVPVEEAINLGLITSKGCVGNCNFCSYTENDLLEGYGVRSVIDELKYIKQEIGDNGIQIRFLDEFFSLNSNRILSLCKEIEKENLIFDFWCCTRLDVLSYDVLDKLKKANFNNIVVGLESASDDILNKMGKLRNGQEAKEFLEDMIDKYKYAKSIGLELVLSVNFGLLGEELEDAYKTLDFIIENNVEKVSVNFMTIFPNSRIFRESNYQIDICKHSPTQMPLRTCYKTGNMNHILRKVMQMRLYSEDLPEKQFIERCEILENYTGISYKRNSFENKYKKFINQDDLRDRKEFIRNYYLLNGYLIVKANRLSSKSFYSDNRKKVKIQIDEYDNILKEAYQNDLYIENIAFFRYDDKECTIIINNDACGKKYRFKYFGNNIIEKIEHVKRIYDGFISKNDFEYGEIEECIFDDMFLFSNINIEWDNISLSDSEKEILSNYLNKQSNIYIVINTMVFVYKNFYSKNKKSKISIYSFLNSDFKDIMKEFNEYITIIKSGKFMIIYNPYNKTNYVCNREETILLSDILNKGIKNSNIFLMNALKLKLKRKNML